MNTEEHAFEDGIDRSREGDSHMEAAHPDRHERRPLRIVGEGGTAVTLSPVPMYSRDARSTHLTTAFDIALIDPDHYLVFRNRRFTAEDVAGLARFLTAGLVADDRSDFRSLRGGFGVALIPTSDANDVIVRVEIDPLAAFGQTAGLLFVFVTTRVACWGASRAALKLAHGDVESDLADDLADLLRDRKEGETS